MNGKIVLVVIIIAIILAAAGFLVYKFYEKPKQEKETLFYNNLSIEFVDINTKEIVPVNYVVRNLNSDEIIKSGRSLDKGYIREFLPLNYTFYIFNTNTTGKYYTTQYIYSSLAIGTATKNINAKIDLVPIGVMSARQLPDFNSSVKSLELSSNGTIKSLVICETWSDNYITVSLVNYTKMLSLPDFMIDKANRCYNTQEFLLSSNKTFYFDYKKFGELGANDYIRVFIFDKDITPWSINNCPDNCYVIRNENNEDVGAPDIVFELK